MVDAFAFAVTTAPRPTPTLARSLASFRAAGWTQPVLVQAEADPGPLGDPHGTVTVNPHPLGVLANWVATFRALVESTTAPYLVMVQDDVSWAAGSADVAARRCAELDPFWTWYVDPKVARCLEVATRRPALRPGAYRSSLGYQSNGALCYGFRRELAERLAADDRLAGYLVTHRQNIDHVVPDCCLALGQPLQVWVPGLINHALGSGNSSIKRKRPKDTRYWKAVAA